MYLSGTSMAAPMVSGAAALLIQGNPNLTPAQVKFALQNGAAYAHEAGLMGAGAGSVNVWASRLIAEKELASAVTTVVGGVTETSSGASFWDVGTLAGRLDAATGIRVLSALDVSQLWSRAASPRFGDLNVLGLANPLTAVASKPLQYGAIAGWTTDQTIVWGTPMQDPSGQSILWGTSDDESILWGTSDDSILWGTGDDSILWGTSILTSPEAR
jgi:serine protease AprX